MRKLRELFGGNLARILEELAPIIREIVLKLLTDLLRELVSPASVTLHAGDAGKSSRPPTTDWTPEQLESIRSDLHTAVIDILRRDTLLTADGVAIEPMWPSPQSPGSATGGDPTPQRPGA